MASKRQKVENDSDDVAYGSSNTSFLDRVSNSVSGLLSSVPWLRKSRNEHYEAEAIEVPSTSQGIADFQRAVKSIRPLYPEEGLVDSHASKDPMGFIDMNKEDRPMSIVEMSHHEMSSFARDYEFSYCQTNKPIVSSSPVTFSPSLLIKKRKAEGMLGEDALQGPSTSNVRRGESLVIPEGSFEMLKKSLYGHLEDTPVMKASVSVQTSYSDPYHEEKELCEETMGSRRDTNIFNSPSEAPVRKKPRFSISTYGSPFLGKQHNEGPAFSIFYPGKVMYGGASSHRKLGYRLPRKPIPRANLSDSVTSAIKDPEDCSLSSAAKRILSCIDKISTPLSTSKRVYFAKRRDPEESSYVADFHKHRPSSKPPAGSPPISKLLAPVKVSVNQFIPSMLEKKVEPVNDLPLVGTSSSNSSSSTCSSLVSKPLHCSTLVTSVGSSLPVSTASKKTIASIETPALFVDSKIIEKTTSPKVAKLPTSLMLPSVVDFLVKTKEKSPLKDRTYTFSDPIPLSLPETSQNPISHSFPDAPQSKNSHDGKFSFSKPVEVIPGTETTPTLETSSLQEPKSNKGSTTLVLTNGLEAFLPPKGCWECEECLLQNPESTSKCLACEARKTGGSCTVDNALPRIKTTCSSSTTSNWGEAFKPPSGSWECKVCLLQNSESSDKCVACQSSRDNEPSSMSKVYNSWANHLTTPADSWMCESCSSRNVGHENSCRGCKTLKVSKKTFKCGFSSMPEITALSNATPLKAKDEWTCETCLIRNKESSVKCISCEAPKNKVEVSALVSEALTGNFTFRPTNNDIHLPFTTTVSINESFPILPTTQTTKLSTGFNFGFKEPEVLSVDTPKIVNDIFPNSQLVGKLFNHVQENKPEEKTSALFTFGTPLESAASASSLFTFGSNSKDESSTRSSNSTSHGLLPPTEFKPSLTGMDTSAGMAITELTTKPATTKSLTEVKFSFGDGFKPKPPVVGNQDAVISQPSDGIFVFGNSSNIDSSKTEAPPAFPYPISGTKSGEPIKSNDKPLEEQNLPKPMAPFSFGNTTISLGTASTKVDTPIYRFSGNALPPAAKPAEPFTGFKINETPKLTFDFGGVVKASTPSFPFSETSQLNFNFGAAAPTSSTSVFGFSSQNGSNSGSVFQFGQQSKVSQPSSETLNTMFSIQDNNPFNVLSSPTAHAPPSKRIIKRAHRRNKL